MNQEIQLQKFIYQNTRFKIIADLWFCGPSEKDYNKQKFDGAYPSGFLKNWKIAFEDYIPESVEEILHVCAGRVPRSEGVRLDIDRKYDPEFLCNAENMHLVGDNAFTWTLADPPYNVEASEKYYKKKLLSKHSMLKEMIRVTKPTGFIGILDQTMPQLNPHLSKKIKCVARIGVTSVPNLDMRVFTVFRKNSNHL